MRVKTRNTGSKESDRKLNEEGFKIKETTKQEGQRGNSDPHNTQRHSCLINKQRFAELTQLTRAIRGSNSEIGTSSRNVSISPMTAAWHALVKAVENSKTTIEFNFFDVMNRWFVQGVALPSRCDGWDGSKQTRGPCVQEKVLIENGKIGGWRDGSKIESLYCSLGWIKKKAFACMKGLQS